MRRLGLAFQVEQRIGRDALEQVIVGEQYPVVRRPEADQPRRVSGQVQHLGGKMLEVQHGSRRERLDLLQRPGHAPRILEVDLHVLEQVRRRAQLRQICAVHFEAARGAVAAGELVVVSHMRVHRRTRRLLRGARIAVVIDVAVADEDAPYIPKRKPQFFEAFFQRLAALARADARVEERDAAVRLLDHVDVGRPARLGKRDGNRDSRHAESVER